MKQALFTAIMLCLQASPASAESLKLQPATGNSVDLYVDKTGVLSGKRHHFVFSSYTGTVDYNPQTPAASKVQFVIDAKSIVCKDTWVSEKDLTKIAKAATVDMLAADRFPEIRFVSDLIKQTGPEQFDVNGNLTIREVTRPVRVQVKLGGNGRFEGEAALKLTDFHLKPPSTALGLVGTKDEMRMTFALTAAKSSAAVKPTE
jgi:polyisoprenoid-binding protein YceI